MLSMLLGLFQVAFAEMDKNAEHESLSSWQVENAGRRKFTFQRCIAIS